MIAEGQSEKRQRSKSPLNSAAEPRVENVDIRDYSDYRDFLRDRFEALKQTRKHLSYQVCANKLRTTRSYLKLVLDKKRHISAEKIAPIGHLFNLNFWELEYFTFLYFKNTIQEPEIARYFEFVLSTLKNRRLSDLSEDHKSLEPLKSEAVWSKWLSFQIFSLAELTDFEPNADWIARNLSGTQTPSKEQIEIALDELLSNGSIYQATDESGHTRYRAKLYFDRANESTRSGFETFQRTAEQAAKAAADPMSFFPVSFNITTLTLSKSQFDRLRELNAEYIKQLRALGYRVDREKDRQEIALCYFQSFHALNRINPDSLK